MTYLQYHAKSSERKTGMDRIQRSSRRRQATVCYGGHSRLKLACRRLAVDSSLGIMKEEFSERFAPMVPPMLKEKVWVTEIERDSAREQVLSFA